MMEINPRSFTLFIVVCVGILLRPAYSLCNSYTDISSCAASCNWVETGFCEDASGSGCDNYHDQSSCPSGSCNWRETSYCEELTVLPPQPAPSLCDSYTNISSYAESSLRCIAASCNWVESGFCHDTPGSGCDNYHDQSSCPSGSCNWRETSSCEAVPPQPSLCDSYTDISSCAASCNWVVSGFCSRGCENYHDQSSCLSDSCTWRETSSCGEPAPTMAPVVGMPIMEPAVGMPTTACISYPDMTSCDADPSCQWAGSYCDYPYDSCGDVFTDNAYICHDSNKVLDVFKRLADINKSETELNSECCVVGNCYLHMTSTNQQCQSGEMRMYMDWHRPDGVDDVSGWSSVDVQNECCQNSCFSTMQNQSLICPAGLFARSRYDYRDPFETQDWSTLTPAAIISGCCERNCYTEMMSKALTCDTGMMRLENDFTNPWEDTTNEFPADKTPEELKASTCCQRNCYDVMGERSLTCSSGSLRDPTDWHSLNSYWSYDAFPDILLLSECCEGGDEPPLNSACETPSEFIPGAVFTKYCSIHSADPSITKEFCESFSYNFHAETTQDKFCYIEVDGSFTDYNCTTRLQTDSLLPSSVATMKLLDGDSCSDLQPDGNSYAEYCYKSDIRDNYDAISTNCCGGNKMVCQSSSVGSPPSTGSVLFKEVWKECRYPQNPESRGDELATNIGISTASSLFVQAPNSTSEFFVRIKMIKPGFKKNEAMDMDKVVRKSYRSEHIDKYFHHCIAPTLTAASAAASELNIDEATFAFEWPEMSGYSYYKVDLPGFDVSNLSMYAKYRLELSSPANTPSVGTLVHACTKEKVGP